MKGALSSIITILVIALLSINIFLFVTGSYINDYWVQRNQFMALESNMQIGGGLELNYKEQQLNKYLMNAKWLEYKQGMENQTLFLASQNFFNVKPLIDQSDVFKFIQKMPKGAVLHGHDSALVSEDFVFNLTFMDNLYFCNSTDGLIRFQFSKNIPMLPPMDIRLQKTQPYNTECEWKLLQKERATSKNVDELNNYIRSKLTLRVSDPKSVYLNGDLAWDKFRDIFSTVIPLVTYRPVLEKYWYQAYLEYYEDNIMYMEFRGTLPFAYDLDGTTYDEIQVAGMYYKQLQQFKRDYPDFHGVRFIYAPYRLCTNKTLDDYLLIYKKLVKYYPDFIAGFDLVGQEDQGEPLIEFVSKLIQYDDIKFFFHAGETNWFGLTDLNLVDAVLLGAYRIGHGYALDKHPHVLNLVKENKIGIEVCPISNQVLGLVQDLRNHPAAALLAQNYPIVIASDDPGFWGSKGLSYDFYLAFMAFTSYDSGLSALKQLALNSIVYSAMPLPEQEKAVMKFERQWNKFVGEMLSSKDFSSLNEIP